MHAGHAVAQVVAKPTPAPPPPPPFAGLYVRPRDAALATPIAKQGAGSGLLAGGGALAASRAKLAPAKAAPPTIWVSLWRAAAAPTSERVAPSRATREEPREVGALGAVAINRDGPPLLACTRSLRPRAVSWSRKTCHAMPIFAGFLIHAQRRRESSVAHTCSSNACSAWRAQWMLGTHQNKV